MKKLTATQIRNGEIANRRLRFAAQLAADTELQQELAAVFTPLRDAVGNTISEASMEQFAGKGVKYSPQGGEQPER
jgi:hypothetical protein